MEDPTPTPRNQSPSNDDPTLTRRTTSANVDSPGEIKEESAAPGAWSFAAGEPISLVEDDEDDGLDQQTSRFPGHSEADNTIPTPELSGEARKLAAQRKFAQLAKKLQTSKAASPPANPTPGPSKVKDYAALKYSRAKQAFERKMQAGTATLEEEIDWMKLQAQEQDRLRKAKLDEEYDRSIAEDEDDSESDSSDDDVGHGDDLFVPEFNHPEFNDDRDETPEPTSKKGARKRKNDDNEGESAPARKRGRPSSKTIKATKTTKGRRKVPGAAYDEDEFDELIAGAKRQSSKPKQNKKKPTSGRAASGKGKGSKRTKGPQMTNLSSIMGTDVFRDTAANQHLPDQPVFEPTTLRKSALKQLIASVPTGDKDAKKNVSTDTRYLDDAIKSFTGQKAVRPGPDGGWSLKGMKSTLKGFQVMGASFMRRRETGSVKPRGGIMADEMGLGKTVMCLANIVNGRQQDKTKVKTTLIVASPALVSQWASEIAKHCHMGKDAIARKAGIVSYMQYRAGYRIAGSDPVAVLHSHDIVLTTYHEVAKSYPQAEVPPEKTTAAEKDEWWRDYYVKHRGILHSTPFHRVVLDEAHAIKNHQSRTSMACRGIVARHRWAITGTPVMNSIKEFYPYFRFLQEPYTGSYKIFKANFCSPGDPDGMTKLAVFLTKVMIRRTHADQFLSARLLDIPTPTQHTEWLEFNNVERQIYEIVRRRFILKINQIAKSGQLQKQYRNILTMVLRLRQICSHSLLIQETMEDLLDQEDFEKLSSITTDETENDEGGSLIVHLRNSLRRAETRVGDEPDAIFTSSESVPTDLTEVIIADPATLQKKAGRHHGLNFKFRRYLQDLVGSERWDEIASRTECAGCRQKPLDPQVTSCFHIYCKPCLHDLQHMAARRGHDQARCSECGEAYTGTQACQGLDSFTVRSNSASIASKATPATQSSQGKKRKQKVDEWINMAGEVLPSAKTMATKAQLLNWLEDDPSSKIVIYTQFVPMVLILSKICHTEGWGYVEYTGKMSHDARVDAIKEFGEDPSKNIMLASLKAGGEGLNLTMATRVICLDPWWNNAVEQQAFCRIYRIGQIKETQMTRFFVKNTVEESMFALKKKKQVEIDDVLAESKKTHLPSVEDLMRLFGEVREGDDGHPFIIPQSHGPEAEEEEEEEEQHRLAVHDSSDEMDFLNNDQ